MTPPAHPRSRGENRFYAVFSAPGPGSSPLTRGKHTPLTQARSQSRLIPAHAGKTGKTAVLGRGLTAHPRSRGENVAIRGKNERQVGSSPLTRGKRRPSIARTSSTGLIPAHAGKTTARTPSGSRSRAHPRSRGENSQRAAGDGSNTGSSPLTRGKLLLIDDQVDTCGLIPAHAGKTSPISCMRSRIWAHPRSRGENFALDSRRRTQLGSSPLTRGKQVGAGFRRLRGRLIPAHAGKTTETARFAL